MLLHPTNAKQEEVIGSNLGIDAEILFLSMRHAGKVIGQVGIKKSTDPATRRNCFQTLEK
jgi:hypothetical protein